MGPSKGRSDKPSPHLCVCGIEFWELSLLMRTSLNIFEAGVTEADVESGGRQWRQLTVCCTETDLNRNLDRSTITKYKHEFRRKYR